MKKISNEDGAGLARKENAVENAVERIGSSGEVRAVGALTPAAEANARRAVAEAQGAILVAKQFPRDQNAALDRILVACQRKSLAEAAMYEYPRGGQRVTGPSIRLAEAIAREWGNLQFGVQELAQGAGESSVMAYAWDLETNTRAVKTFQVPHIRDTKQGPKPLSESRDIYEMVANQGARRLRACILSVIPGDITEAAVAMANKTKRQSIGDPQEEIQKLIPKFEKIGVSAKRIAMFLRHNIEAVTVDEIIRLKNIGSSIKDGYAGADDYFPPEEAEKEQDQKGLLKEKAAKAKKQATPEKPEEQQPEAAESGVEPTDAELAAETEGGDDGPEGILEIY